jgi:hypothetical protein
MNGGEVLVGGSRLFRPSVFPAKQQDRDHNDPLRSWRCRLEGRKRRQFAILSFACAGQCMRAHCSSNNLAGNPPLIRRPVIQVKAVLSISHC